ncbi:MAG: MmgE/PrpD family protein [Chloroflexi bacterium]|nr:MmgE/PrpD family protein [Chloroflexota bacterium]
MAQAVHVTPIMQRLSAYIAAAPERSLPPEVAERTKHHILDTVAAMVSGSRLKPGVLAIQLARAQGGTPEALVVGSDVVTTAINAATANGFLGHADETDDSHAPSLTHPGCAIVPAALAMAEREAATGEALIRAVALGYDVGCRIARAMSRGSGRVRGHSSHAIGGQFGAAAAACGLARLDPRQVRSALAYAAQQASGITSWMRDPEHVEKAFVFAGMGARNGVTAATFVQAGFTGEEDVFSGPDNFLEVFCPNVEELGRWAENLGSHYEVAITNIKKFPVGSPIQAAAEALTDLVAEHHLTPGKVRRIEVHLPPEGSRIVDNRAMPDINCQYIMAVILLDGRLTFKAAHTPERMQDPKVQGVQSRVTLVPSPEFQEMERQRPARVRVHLATGEVVECHVPAIRGTYDNPMTRDEVAAKSMDLMEEVLGRERAQALVARVWELERVGDVRDLRPLLRV